MTKAVLSIGILLFASGCVTSGNIPQAGSIIRDCSTCPKLVVVPPGTFEMGSPVSDKDRFDDEGPVHRVTVSRGFAVMRNLVTVADYRQYSKETGARLATGCHAWNAAGDWQLMPGFDWNNPGFEQSERDPVVCVSWNDAQSFADWLSAKTGRAYRLLTEAEFEYASRSGTTARYPWGDRGDQFCRYANGFDQATARGNPSWGTGSCNDGYAFTSPVGSFPANAFNLQDMTGNAFQWVEDCFVEGGYVGAPTDGSARNPMGCKIRVIRGGSWNNGPRGLRIAMRDRDPQDGRYNNITIRLARDLD